MNKVIFSIPAMLAFALFAETPHVDSDMVSVARGENGTTVKISYTLTGEPAVVTIDVQTNTLSDASGNWVSIGGEGMGFLGGEANKVVYKLGSPVDAYWFPPVSFSDGIPAGGLRAVVKAWPTNSPPDYMAVNLTGAKNVVRFYESTALLPGGFANSEYKTTKLLMRKIPAAGVVWRMGMPDDEYYASSNAVTHKVMLTEDYYAGVFEMTQGQLTALGGSNESSFQGYDDSPLRPAERVKHFTMRGQSWSGSTYCWPEKGHDVSGTSVLGVLRARCGIADMDFPTEAQWEYACRAGKGTSLHNGTKLDTEDPSVTSLKQIAVTLNNATDPVHGVKMPHVAGSKTPNAWGLYDMLGNVYEMCLDRSGVNANLEAYKQTFTPGWETGAVTTNPAGVASTSVQRLIKRGGAWMDSVEYCTCGVRADGSINYQGTQGYIGCRFFCSVKEAVK